MNHLAPTTAQTTTATCIHRRYYGSAGHRVMFRLMDGSTAIWDTQTMPVFYSDREYTIAFRVQDTNAAQKRLTITHVRKV